MADYLSLRGVRRARVATIGYGERYPVADNATEEGRARNRRVEIKITPVTQDEVNAAATDRRLAIDREGPEELRPFFLSSGHRRALGQPLDRRAVDRGRRDQQAEGARIGLVEGQRAPKASLTAAPASRAIRVEAAMSHSKPQRSVATRSASSAATIAIRSAIELGLSTIVRSWSSRGRLSAGRARREIRRACSPPAVAR